jgi:hypothetical protein
VDVLDGDGPLRRRLDAGPQTRLAASTGTKIQGVLSLNPNRILHDAPRAGTYAGAATGAAARRASSQGPGNRPFTPSPEKGVARFHSRRGSS